MPNIDRKKRDEIAEHRCKEYETVKFIFYFLPSPYLGPFNEGASLARPISGLSGRLISHTNIHANLSICLQSFRHDPGFLSLSKASVLRSPFPGDVIRKKEEEREGT